MSYPSTIIKVMLIKSPLNISTLNIDSLRNQLLETRKNI